jgi:hypothetical protein
MTWDALNQLGAQYGSPDIDYDRFAARWDSQDPQDAILKKLVSNFDEHGVVIKTDVHEPKPQQGQKQTSGLVPSAMAATNRAFS